MYDNNHSSSMPPQPAASPTPLSSIDQANRMVGQLAWCVADSSPIRQQLLDFGLDTESAQAAITALNTQENQTAITQLHDSFISSTFGRRHSHIGHYIKTSVQPESGSNAKKDHVNISVMRNTASNNVEIIIKPKGERERDKSFFEGAVKHATKSVKLALTEDGLLTVSPVMAIKAKSNEVEKFVSDELHASSLTTDSCLFISGGPDRINQVRHYQTNKGVTVTDCIKNQVIKTNEDSVQMAMQYMDQVGSQLNALHQRGAAHFDCKLQNILYDKRNGLFTVIDIPAKKYDPTREQDPDKQESIGKTLGLTTIPTNENRSGHQDIDKIFENTQRVRLIGHVSDSYAYLRGLYAIADSMPDGLVGPSKEKEALKSFVVGQMSSLASQINTFAKNPSQLDWEDPNMTVDQVKKEFKTFCLDTNNALDTAFKTSQSTPKVTAQDGGLIAPPNVDIVLKKAKENSFVMKTWMRLFSKFFPETKIKQALSSASTLMTYSGSTARNTGWKIVADAQHIKDSSFQAERLRLARVLIVAEVTDSLKENPRQDFSACVTKVISERTQNSNPPDSSANSDLLEALTKSQSSLVDVAKNIHESSEKARSTQNNHTLLGEAQTIAILHQTDTTSDKKTI